MKKFVSGLLAAALAFTLAACGGAGSGSTAPAPASSGNGAVSTESHDDEPGSTAADSDLAAIRANGKMVIGYTVYEPMNYTDENGEFTGFDTELARAVCEILGVDAEFTIIDWNTKFVELESGSIDAVWNGMTLDPEIEANQACTEPYVKNAQVIVMKAGSAYDGTASLTDSVIAVEIGSAGESTVDGDENLSQAEKVGKSVQTECLMEVKAGTAAAAVLDLTLANAMTGEGTDYNDLVIVDELGTEEYGVAFRKGSDAAAAVNDAFAQLRADGTMQALADKYGLTLAE